MSTAETSPNTATRVRPSHRPRVPVWDLAIRLFHWSLVLAVSLAAVSGFLLDRRALTFHLVGGIAAAALVICRVVWGFLGPAHARFSDFLRGPSETLGHLRAVFGPPERRYVGHNPLGAMMVVAMIFVLLALALSGLAVLGGMLKAGPFAFALDFATGSAAKGLHTALAIGLLAMIALHLGGVVHESLRGKENLVRAMIDGRKEARSGDAPTRPGRARPLFALALCLLAGGAIWQTDRLLAARPVPGLPPQSFPAAYAAACSDCHGLFSPSLLPAASWHALMAGLGQHFGEDASVDPAARNEVEAWLADHAAETADTLAANQFRRVAASDPVRITATPFWQRMHRHIPAATFADPVVGARSNCGACHSDAAQGLFYPSNIALPKETK